MKARLTHILESGIVYGVTLTLIVTGLFAAGYLQTPENWLYDKRAAVCQIFMPPPTDRLVYLDIDDATLESCGRWPWPRTVLAEMIDEIRLANPKVLAFDVVFPEPSNEPSGVRYVKRADGHFDEINDDRNMAEALARLGKAIVPLSISPATPATLTRLERTLRDALTADLELTETTVPDELVRRGMDRQEVQQAIAHGMVDRFTHQRRDVMYDRIIEEMQKASLSRDELRRKLLPHTDQGVNTAASRLFDEQFPRAESQMALLRFTRPVPPNLALPLLHANAALTPVASFSRAAAATAFVDDLKDEDGKVRKLPLVMEYDGRIYPQMGLELAAMMLDADFHDFKISNDRIVVPRPGDASIEIPLDSPWSVPFQQHVPMEFDIPAFGDKSWTTMYDRIGGAHIPLTLVWDACLTRHRIYNNNRNADDAVEFILNGDPNSPNDTRLGLAPDRAQVYAMHRPDPLDSAARVDIMTFALKTLDESKYIELFSNIKDPKPDEKKRLEDMIDTRRDLDLLLKQSGPLENQLKAQRLVLNKRLANRALLIGWTATSSVTDRVDTPIQVDCPAVVVHGMIFNAIMTGKMLHRAPLWINIAITLVLGLMATGLAARLSPARALFSSFMLAIGYVALNGWILYDLRSQIVTLAGPLIVIGVVWAGCTLARLLHESWERIRIAMETAGLRHEMDLAKRAQEALIPREPPGVPGFDAVGWTMPASTTGGDCFDLWKAPDGRLGILLADASGHGLGPAMIVTQVRTLVRALCEFECDPHRLLGLVNSRLNADLEGGKFVTAFLGFLSTEGVLSWSSAGHGPVFIRTHAGGEMLELQPPALPLGIMPDWEDAAPAPVTISPGGLILLCSDGIFEAAAPPNKEMFGVPRMVETIEIHPDGDSTTRVTSLSEAVRIWYAGTEPLDDQTIVIVRRTQA